MPINSKHTLFGLNGAQPEAVEVGDGAGVDSGDGAGVGEDVGGHPPVVRVKHSFVTSFSTHDCV